MGITTFQVDVPPCLPVDTVWDSTHSVLSGGMGAENVNKECGEITMGLLAKYKADVIDDKTTFGLESVETISLESPLSKVFDWYKKRKEERNVKKEAKLKTLERIAKDFEKVTNIVSDFCGKQNLTIDYGHLDMDFTLVGKGKFANYYFEAHYISGDSGKKFNKVKNDKGIEFGVLEDSYAVAEGINFTNTKLDKIVEYLNDDELYDLEESLLEPGIKLISNHKSEPFYFIIFSYDATNTTIKLNRQDRGYGSSIGLLVNEVNEDSIINALKNLEEDSKVEFDKMKYKSWFRS